MSEGHFKVAAAHASPEFLDVAAGVNKVCRLVSEAGHQNIRLLVFPEVFLPGFPHWINCYPPLTQAPLNARYRQASITVPGIEIDAVRDAARSAGCAVVLGVSERDGGTCYNTQVFIDADGTYIGKHRKLQPTYAERYIWGQGNGSTLRVWESAVGRISGLACWEHTHNLARHALILQGMQIHAASWPALSTVAGFGNMFDAQVDAMMRSHALTGQCFVVVAQDTVTRKTLSVMEDALGSQDLVQVGGGSSAVIHPWGHYIAGPHTGADETLVTATIDLNEIDDVKAMVDSAGHYGRPEILQLTIDMRDQTGLRMVSDPENIR
ncbi:MAG: carbon-nitrogen hydrolase family protein [Spiribacter salinus]|uniref:Carbon-nitrogen hydrolase family protein n=1 Tax=Spiribacter salinus TaxID=1335746 RepID=A0A540VVB0_9GAMM|nr:MAG: carbon-nitrogen hydrolase family protein [Spiribacter salinus]